MRQETRDNYVRALATKLNEERRRRWVEEQEFRKLPALRKRAKDASFQESRP